jgi:hypothetical protein
VNSESQIHELKEAIEKHKTLRFKELQSPKERPERLLGTNGIHLLLKHLERSYDLIEGTIDSFERNKTLQFWILTRAHFETTASLCFFYRNLIQFYENKINQEKIDELIGEISTGSRLEPIDSDYHQPTAVNVLKEINDVDKLLKKGGIKGSHFRRGYDIASEFCHPNLLGLTYKTKVNVEKGNVLFLDDSEFFKKYEKSSVPRLLNSVTFFLLYYDKTYSLLNENETMPILIK